MQHARNTSTSAYQTNTSQGMNEQVLLYDHLVGPEKRIQVVL